MNKLIRTIHPEVKVVDASKGIVDYVASDESVDSYREIIRANGWKFTNFKKNAPFVDRPQRLAGECHQLPLREHRGGETGRGGVMHLGKVNLLTSIATKL
jgi:hypothetical protein